MALVTAATGEPPIIGGAEPSGEPPVFGWQGGGQRLDRPAFSRGESHVVVMHPSASDM
ncbi:MAG TPA: hypothetical protein VKX24_06510 [Acidimicrobiia bacterium]|nr:hypothetical protein [Acidimicrobiia bacterium]